jgi:hypothetical protein
MSWKDKYNKVGKFYEGRAIVILNNKEGHVDKNGNVTTPVIYDFVGDFHGGRAWVESSNGKHGYVDKNGKVIDGFHDLIVGAFK